MCSMQAASCDLARAEWDVIEGLSVAQSSFFPMFLDQPALLALCFHVRITLQQNHERDNYV